MSDMSGVDALLLKIVGVASIGWGIVGGLFAPGATVPFFGVQMTTFGMAVAGSLLAFAYAPPLTSRKRLYGYAVGGVFVGVWGVQILPAWLGLEWYDPRMEPPMAGFVALSSRWVVPLFVEHLPEIISRMRSNPPRRDEQ